MKEYQDTETGMIYAFEDDYDPLTANNRNLPQSLSADVKPKPDESHVWYQGNWIKHEDAPVGYKPPISSVPSYNPAWMAYIRPYSAVHRDASSCLNITLDQINANSYDGSKLAEVVAQLPLNNASGIPALISYDGAIAIPQCDDYPSRADGVRKLNEILCSLLLGGISVEILRSEELVIGQLHNKTSLFDYTPSRHTALRLNWAALADRLQPLMHPRVLTVDEIRHAYEHGQQVIQAIASCSPLFLLGGYTAMVYRNNSDALNNLWITVEQVTEHIWRELYIKKRSSFPAHVVQEHLASKKTHNRIFTKHRLLFLANFLDEDCYRALDRARHERNKLAHQGIVPESGLIEQLWNVLPVLIEVASGMQRLGLRRLSGGVTENWDAPMRTDFHEWVTLAKEL